MSQLLDGLEMDAGQPVLVVDLIPSRFAEWSHACWEFMKPKLQGQSLDSNDIEIYHAAIYNEEDNDMMQDSLRAIAGKMMSQWWDTAEEAGEKSRPNTQFGVDPPTLKVVTVSQEGKAMHLGVKERFESDVQDPRAGAKEVSGDACEGLKAVMDKLSENVLIAQALTARAKSTSSGSKGGQPQRTSASPDWLGELVPNYRKRLVPPSIGIAEFDGSNPSGA